MKISSENVAMIGFGVNCFSVIAPTGIDTEQLMEFLKKSNACQREQIEFDYTYESDEKNKTCYVFKESGAWLS